MFLDLLNVVNLVCQNLAILQDGLSCLHLKETLESPDIVQLLIDKGADVDNPTDVRCYTDSHFHASLVPRFSPCAMKYRTASDGKLRRQGLGMKLLYC